METGHDARQGFIGKLFIRGSALLLTLVCSGLLYRYLEKTYSGPSSPRQVFPHSNREAWLMNPSFKLTRETAGTPGTPDTARHILALDGIRGLAILMVMVFHYHLPGDGQGLGGEPVGPHG